MGLGVLPFLEFIFKERKAICDVDNNLDFPVIKKLKLREETEWNYSYYPIMFDSEETY